MKRLAPAVLVIAALVLVPLSAAFLLSENTAVTQSASRRLTPCLADWLQRYDRCQSRCDRTLERSGYSDDTVLGYVACLKKCPIDRCPIE